MTALTTRVRAALASFTADARLRARRQAFRCATEAVLLEQQGADRSYDCAHWWLGAVLNDAWARFLGYSGPTLEEWLGRPPRPMRTP